MKPNELEVLLQDLPPETIRARYGEELTPENLAFLEAYAQFDLDLTELPRLYQMATPPAPNLPDFGSVRGQIRPWYRRPISLTPLQGLLAAAALVLVGFLSFYFTGPGQPSNVDSWQAALRYTRGGEDEDSLKKLDRNLIESLLDRGYHFFQKGDEPGYRKALDHFLLASSIEPDNVRILKSLILCYEMLGDQKAVADYKKRLETAEKNALSPLKP